MTAVPVQTKPNLDIGKVFKDAFGVMKRRFVIFSVALLIASIPSAINQFMQFGAMRAALAGGASPAAVGGGLLIGFAMILLGLVLAPTVYAAITYASVQDLDGAPFDFAGSLKIGLRNWGGFIGLVLLMIIPLFVGFIFLVVPGVMLFVAWSVAVPAKIAERIGPIKALGRSLELTKGKRWMIFLFGLIVMIVVWVLEIVVLGLMAPLFASVVATPGPAATAKFVGLFTNPVSLVLFTLLGVLANVIAITLGAALYHQLRVLHDGPSVQNLGEVFA